MLCNFERTFLLSFAFALPIGEMKQANAREQGSPALPVRLHLAISASIIAVVRLPWDEISPRDLDHSILRGYAVT